MVEQVHALRLLESTNYAADTITYAPGSAHREWDAEAMLPGRPGRKERERHIRISRPAEVAGHIA